METSDILPVCWGVRYDSKKYHLQEKTETLSIVIQKQMNKFSEKTHVYNLIKLVFMDLESDYNDSSL